MDTPAPIPPLFPDKYNRTEAPIGEPIGDYNEYRLRCAVLNQAIEGYHLTEAEIEDVRKGIPKSGS